MSEKFLVVQVSKDLSFKRVYINSAQAIKWLETNEDARLYRPAFNQEAELVMEREGGNSIVWKDVEDG